VDHEQLRLAVAADLSEELRFTEPRAARLLRLRRLDAAGIDALTARAPAPMDSAPTYSVPRAFLCSDGGVWWLKSKAQQGLAVEVVAGRLAKLVGAGPGASPVYVGSDAIAGQLGLLRFEGHVAGIEHRPGVESSKRLARLMGGGGIAMPVNGFSRALVVTFQTWLHVADPQVLINILTGEVETYDHGDTFGQLLKGPPSAVVIARIPGVADHFGLGRAELDAAVRRVEALTELEILWAVSGLPDRPGWRASFARRLAIAEWLIRRQGRLREVLMGWGVRPS
jgi:hypothetical protein